MSTTKSSPPPLTAFGLLVRETRIRKGLTHQRAAKGAGVSRKQWSLLEKGENASAVFIQKVAAFLDLHVIPLGDGLEATTQTGGVDVTALFRIADDLVALTAVLAERLRAFALEAVMPPSERGRDAKAIAALVARGEELVRGDVGGISGRIDHLTSKTVARGAGSSRQSEQTMKRRNRRA